MLAAEASWESANVYIQTHGGFGFAEEYDVERKFRETQLYQVAPISTNLIQRSRRASRSRDCAKQHDCQIEDRESELPFSDPWDYH